MDGAFRHWCRNHMSPTDDQINSAISLLRAVGYSVELPDFGPWQKPGDVWAGLKTIHLSFSGFHKRLNDFTGTFPQKLGPSGRRILMRTTPELIAWLERPSSAMKERA